MDCTSSRSKTALKVVPPFTDFQTPPLAAPTKMVMRPFSSTASSAAMRPLIVAEPILRAGRPEMVAASKRYGACAAAKAANSAIPAMTTIKAWKLRADRFMSYVLFQKVNSKNPENKILNDPVTRSFNDASRKLGLVNADHARFPFFRPQRLGQRKICGIDVHVHFDVLHRCSLRVWVNLGSRRNCKCEHDSRYGLVRAQAFHRLAYRTANELLDFAANLNESIGIEIVVDNVAILECHFQAQSVVAIDDIVS